MGSRSRSPARRSRPVAADFFQDGTQSRSRSRSRSRSPEDDRHRKHRHQHHRRHRHRSRDAEANPDDRREHKRRKRDHHHKQANSSSAAAAAAAAPQHDPPPLHAELPFGGRALSYRHDLDAFTPLLAYYLDIQKGRDFYGMGAQERRGRWKSFVHKWNRGELAEGWYDPEMFERVVREAAEADAAEDVPIATAAASQGKTAVRERGSMAGVGDEALAGDTTRMRTTSPLDDRRRGGDEEDEDEDDDYGPPPPPGQTGVPHGGGRARARAHGHGPGIPTLDDLALQREDAASAREAERAEQRFARRAERALQQQQLDEILPRAEPGTRERQLEKRALVSEKMRGFKEARAEGGGIEEVGDGELMGGGGFHDDVRALKAAAAQQQRKKTERELRREAEARARMEEREEKLREWREREEEKMKGLKELARARFG